MGKASTLIKDLPESEISDKVEIDMNDILSDTSSNAEDETPNPTKNTDYYKETIEGVMKKGADSFVVFILFMVLRNRHITEMLTKLPYIHEYTGGIYGDIFISILAALLFYVCKFFYKK